MLEKKIERYLKDRVEMIGGMCLKFESPGCTGVPDRLVLLPGGRAAFVETKAPGKHERPRQRYVQDKFRKFGFPVFSSVDSFEKVEAALYIMQQWATGPAE